MTRPLLYAARPTTAYGTEHERRLLDRLAELAPGAEIVDPATRYASGADWLLDWPRLLGTLSGLVVFGDEAGTIGAGVLREVADAIAWRVPVAMLDEQGGACELASIDFVPALFRTPRQAAVPRAGRRFVGVEIDPVTLAIAAQRLSDLDTTGESSDSPQGDDAS